MTLARDNGVPFGWIGMDSFYGEQPWLLNEINSEGMIYIADIIEHHSLMQT